MQIYDQERRYEKVAVRVESVGNYRFDTHVGEWFANDGVSSLQLW